MINIFEGGDPHIEEPWVVGGHTGIDRYEFLLDVGFSPIEASGLAIVSLHDGQFDKRFVNELAERNRSINRFV